jgi:site-specific DNA-methyltransferase (adenine-specific)
MSHDDLLSITAPRRLRQDRGRDLTQIAEALAKETAVRTSRGVVAGGDSLELLGKFPSQSVSLIVTDPPYHSTKKSNIMGDQDFSDDAEYLSWVDQYTAEWHRILRPNGSLYLFCASEMSAQLEVRIGRLLQPLSHITWTKPNDPGFDGWKGKMQKEALRRWYPHSERILFFAQAIDGHVRRSPLATFLRESREQAGLSGHQLTELVGAYGKVNHGGAVSNWETGRNIPSEEQYGKIKAALEATGRVSDLPEYEDVVRPFRVSRHVEYTDVWTFPSVRVYRGKHPAEKPVDLLRHIVQSSSYEGDLVLDCFSGSGSTLEAAISCNRRAVGLELDERWLGQSALRLEEAESGEAALRRPGTIASQGAPSTQDEIPASF